MLRNPSLALLSVAVLLFAAAAPLAAQDETEAMEQRLEEMERLLQVLQVQVAEQAGAKVVPSTGRLVELRVLVLMNAFTNTNGVFMDDIPQWVLASAVCQECSAGTTASIRQTRLTFTTFAADVVGAEFTGELDLDFFGGQPHSSGGRTFPNLRVRTTRAQLDWPNVSLVVGQLPPPISEINPSSLASMGFPGFTGTGNLWLWLPQVRVKLQTSGPTRFGVEIAVMAPADGQLRDENFYGRPDRAERTRRPFLEGRILASWGEPGAEGELSLGGHLGWLEPAPDLLVQTKAIAASASFFFARQFELRGEAFSGQALQTLGGGGIYQNTGENNIPLSSRGGWLQINYLPNFEWELGIGAGIDDPEDADFGTSSGRSKNVQYEAHAIWRQSPLLAGFEIRRMETTVFQPVQPDFKDSNWHFNLALGFEF